MFKKLLGLLPKYSYIPIISYWCMMFITYYIPLFCRLGIEPMSFALPIDDAIPFVPVFIVPYVLAYVQWFFSFIIISRESEELCYRTISGEMIARLFCVFCFVFFPVVLERPDVSGSGVFTWMTRFIYNADKPTNLFPSIHCLDSWLCFRCAIGIKKPAKWYLAANCILTFLVFAAVVFVKQHYFIDIVAGIAVGELGLMISEKTGADRIFSSLNKKIIKAER